MRGMHHSALLQRCCTKLLVTLGIGAGVASQAAADTVAYSKNITTEAVNDYSCQRALGLGWGDLPNSIADASGFMSGMTQSGSIYSYAHSYTNTSVFTTDFYDPDVTGLSDNDNTYFDHPDLGISYFAGHGGVGSGTTGVRCYSGSTCTSPPSGTSLPAFCRRRPGDNFGVCAYTMLTRTLVTGNCNDYATASRGTTGTYVNYSSGSAKWGESTGWAGAGTNGGTNLVVVDASMAELSHRGQEIWPAFAGVQILATTLDHTGDTANISDRGGNFAARYRANRNGGVANAWNDALNSNGDRNSLCHNEANTQSYGGGFGFNGCGAHNATAVDAQLSWAQDDLARSWVNLQNNALDSLGAGYWASQWLCNYDCATWTFGI